MKIILGVAGWTFRLIVLAILLFLMTNCTMLGLNYASLEVGNKPDARPEIDAASKSRPPPSVTREDFESA